MNEKHLSRRTKLEVWFNGVDISREINHNLKSLTYTDNEENEADDLQIKLEDTDGMWLTQWLDDSIQAASEPDSGISVETAGAGSQYKVTAKSGLNVRSGPGTSNGVLGTMPYGTVIGVKSISGGWASISYSGKDACAHASYLEPVPESAAAQSGGAAVKTKGLRIQAKITRQNWNGDGKDDALDCGSFELDSSEASGPPSEVTIKATALPLKSQVRQTKKSKGWENITLSEIANQIAESNGMTCMFTATHNPKYSRLEQVTESDISFLSRLCQKAGISLKATANMLVLFDQAAFEALEVVQTITRGDKSYTKYKLSTGENGVNYAYCRVSYTDPGTGKLITGTAYAEDYDPEDDKSKNEDGAEIKEIQVLEITAKVSGTAEAEYLAAKLLRLHNKFERTATFTLPGDTKLVAGVTMGLAGWGAWNGKYIIKQARHTVGSGGYTTQITLRRILEGY